MINNNLEYGYGVKKIEKRNNQHNYIITENGLLDWIFCELITPSEGESTSLKFTRKVLAKVFEIAEK